MKGAARVSSPVMFGAVGLLLLVLPWLIGSGYYLHIAITSLVFVILATSLDLLVGYSGLLSLGHTAFFAFGSYAAALLYLHFGVPLWGLHNGRRYPQPLDQPRNRDRQPDPAPRLGCNSTRSANAGKCKAVDGDSRRLDLALALPVHDRHHVNLDPARRERLAEHVDIGADAAVPKQVDVRLENGALGRAAVPSGSIISMVYTCETSGERTAA